MGDRTVKHFMARPIYRSFPVGFLSEKTSLVPTPVLPDILHVKRESTERVGLAPSSSRNHTQLTLSPSAL